MTEHDTYTSTSKNNSNNAVVPSDQEKSTRNAPPDQEFDRVRELILGDEASSQRLGQSEVDRLRDIIFGSNIEDYERRFEDIRREQERVMGDLRMVQDSVGEFEKSQAKRVETLQQEMHRTSDELKHEMKRLGEQLRSREALLQQLLNQARQQEMLRKELLSETKEQNKILAQQERDLKVFRSNVEEHRGQYERKMDALKHEVRQSEDDLRDELRRMADRLDYQKTDRKALASMLMEIATRLETGSSVTGLLEDLTSAS